MIEYLGAKYVPIEEDEGFFARFVVEVAPRLIGCVLHHGSSSEDTAILIAETEAYHEGDGPTHHSDSQRLAGGHVYVHGGQEKWGRCYRNMWSIDLVCGEKGQASSILIRAGVPVVGEDIMVERRKKYERAIRERANGYQKRLCRGPCNVGEALGLHPLLDRASLFKPPFRILRPVSPPLRLLNGPRINVSKDTHRLWRWGHPDYRPWVSAPFPLDEVA
jgi:DNA-3-methyladenine glycosylase